MTNVIGIIRVSQTNNNEQGQVSPEEQLAKLEEACERDGKNLLRVYREMDVSGGRALDKRPGLLAAVEAVETGEAHEVMAAYFDRLFRSLQTQAEVTERVEAAGGRVLALDFGQLSNGSATEWVSASVVGMLAEYQRRSSKERAGAAQARLIGEGKAIWTKRRPPIGFLLNADNTVRVDESRRALLVEVFERRAAGATIKELRDLLRAHGIDRTQAAVQRMLRNPIYIGWLTFGVKLVNREAVEPVVDRDTWDAVQRRRSSRGRYAQSERLLARLGILRCGGCGAKMVASTQTKVRNGKTCRWESYRCGNSKECDATASITAEPVEAFISQLVRERLADAEETESAAVEAREAASAAEAAQRALDVATRRVLLLPEDQEEQAQIVIDELTAERDATRLKAARLAVHGSGLTVNAARDWDRLSVLERRELIAATIDHVRVRRGRAPVAERLEVQLLGE